MPEEKAKKKRISKKRLLILDAVLLLVLLLIDQITKYAMGSLLKEKGSIVLIDGVLQLTYLQNTGGILGVLQNQIPFIIFLAGILLLVVIYFLLKLPDREKFGILHPVLTGVVAGALGNMIDRIRLGYVVDFIYFVGIDFPIFNGADILISVCTLLLIGLFLFYFREKDLDFLTFKQKRYRELK